MLGMWARALVGAACAFALAATAAAQPAPVEAYARLPAVSDAAISPDGRHVIIAQSDATATAFRIINLETQQSVHAARIDNPNTLRWVGWADDQTATFTLSTTRPPNTVAGGRRVYVPGQVNAEYWRTGIYSLASGRTEFLLADVEDAAINTGLVDLQAPIDGDPGYGRMQAWAREGESFRRVIYRVNLRNGRSTLAAFGHGDRADDYLLDPRGEIIARTDADRRSNRWQLYIYENGRPRLLREGVEETGRTPDLMGRMPDGRIVAGLRNDNEDYRYVALDSATGEESLIGALGDRQARCVHIDQYTGVVVGHCSEREFIRSHYYEPALAEVQQVVDELFSDGYGWLVHWSRDRSRFIVYGETARDGGAYYMFEPSTNTMLQLGQRYPELAGADFGVRQFISYPARDGQRVPAYLTLPSGAGRNLPLVVLVHGGPHARDDFSFDYWVSFLVSRGYAVLQPQFRGSTGFGRAWMEAGRGNWGDGVMQHDVTDGVDALVRSGQVDASRVCIVGASYGGYAALAGATLTPEKYACAVSVAGVADLLMMLDAAHMGGRQSGQAEWWRLSIGDPRSDREHLRSISPANLAANVRAPILLMHGAEDTVVPIAQSRLMDRRLREAGKDVRFVELSGDDHWGSSATGRLQMLRELETFLAQHLRAR